MFVYCGNNPICNLDDDGYRYAIGLTVDDNSDYARATKYTGSNYSNYDGDQLLYETKNVHTNLNQSDANYYYETIAAGNYGNLIDIPLLSMMASIVFSVLGFNEAIASYLSFGLETVTSLENAADFSENTNVFDPVGRYLYIEEGYHVVTLDRGFMHGDAFVTETEFFIYDNKWHLQFNDVIATSYHNLN